MTPKPKCKLIGEDGNVFNVVGLARQALRDAGAPPELIKEMTNRTLHAHSFDDVLLILMQYVDVV